MQSDPDGRAMASRDKLATAVQIDALPKDVLARRRIAHGWALVPIVAASGFAGLGYEIVWMRQLSLVLGTEMMAVLGGIAGFFGGLALGAFALDGPIRRAQSPCAVYAVLEAVIGLWGLINIWLLPVAGRALSPLLGTEPAPALLWLASFALPTLVLLPATMAMGGTLTALERVTRKARGNARVRREHRWRRGRNAAVHFRADPGARILGNPALPCRRQFPVRRGRASDRTGFRSNEC
jgi:spermidine synthase